ncbi:hypothetical protein DXD27_01370 [Bacteroides intestinalis]|nr:hypothetical protein DXD27_01370 [Bacteroides intestinalis]
MNKKIFRWVLLIIVSTCKYKSPTMDTYMVFCHNDIQTCKIQNEYTNGQIAYTFYPLKEESQVQSSLQ